MRGLFPLCHCFFSFWHYGIAGQYMTTAIGGGFLSLNKNLSKARASEVLTGRLRFFPFEITGIKPVFKNITILIHRKQSEIDDLDRRSVLHFFDGRVENPAHRSDISLFGKFGNARAAVNYLIAGFKPLYRLETCRQLV
jgi:hypothetical protein